MRAATTIADIVWFQIVVTPVDRLCLLHQWH